MNKKIGAVVVLLLIGCGIFVFLTTRGNSDNAVTSQSKVMSNEVTDTSSPRDYSITEVSEHNDTTSCWTTINGKVYDLTSFVNQHEGGPIRILSICGKDGSEAFNGEHEGQGEPESDLSGFYIGNLSS